MRHIELSARLAAGTLEQTGRTPVNGLRVGGAGLWDSRRFLLSVVFGLAMLAVWLGDPPPNADAAQPHDLRFASRDEIAQYALAVTRAHARVVTGTMLASLVRRTEATELESFGFGAIHLYCGEPPMVLAIVSGDLELTRVPGARPPGAPPVHTDAIAYVFIEPNGKEVGEVWGSTHVGPLLRAGSTAPPRSGSGSARMPAVLPAACTQVGLLPPSCPTGRLSRRSPLTSCEPAGWPAC
jgi:hypothetical protein